MSEKVKITISDLPRNLAPDIEEAAATSQSPVTLAAFGDLMLAGEWDAAQKAGRMAEALGPLAPLADADLVFANLEATTPGDGEWIAKEPRLIGEPETLESALETLPLSLVSLGNNHAFDACLGGFLETRGLLERLGIAYFGAGENSSQAREPVLLERSGLSFAFLALTDEETRPSHVAAPNRYGVHPLERQTALSQIAELRDRADHVIVSVHWGVEYCQLPSPDHIRLGREMIDAGARLVIGHHAHVVQGVEAHGEGVIAYNLGNALTTDLEIHGRRAIHQGKKMRCSFALRAAFSENALTEVDLVPFYAGEGQIQAPDLRARRRLEQAQRGLAAGVTEERWRKVRLYEDVVLRTLKKLHPSVIGSIRPHHFVKFFKNIVGAKTGRGPAA